MSTLKICPQCGSEYELDVRFCPKDGTTLRAQGAANDLVGSIIADRYHVLKKLGEGGMGQVYLAEHVKMGRKSAVKVMNPGMTQDADAIARFNREAANASRITHPNVAAIYDFGETADGLIYLAMEFVEGKPLTSIIEHQGALPAARAADITRQAADALSVAHDMGIVHRDLKPDNIMITRAHDGADLVKVVDFGIAKASENQSQKVTKTGLVVGTPEYMSPEQLAGDKLDGRSDIYSLALVTFNMLTGRLPFPSETVQESMIMRLTDRPRTLREMKEDVHWPDELQHVMDKALSRDANERYAVARDFGRDLVRAVEHMPHTQIAHAGTAVINAAGVPKTHVAPRGPGGTAVGAAASRPASSAAPYGPEGRAEPAKRGNGAMIGGAAAAVVVIGVAGWLLMGRKSGAATDVTSPPASQSGVQSPTPNGPASLPNTTATAQIPAGRTNPSPGRVAHPGSSSTPTGSAPLNAAAALASVKQLAESGDEGDSRKALAEIDQLVPSLNPIQKIEAQYYRAEAYLTLNDTEHGCQILRDLRVEAKGTSFQRGVEVFFDPSQPIHCQ